jgi:hypothetical protein
MAAMSGAVAERDASGNVTELYSGTFTNCTYRECKWGLHNSFQVSSGDILLYVLKLYLTNSLHVM